MQVIVLYNAPTVPPDHPDAESERAVVDNARLVADLLIEGGYKVALLGINDDPDLLLQAVKDTPSPVVFNLFEGPINQGDAEAYAMSVLEWLRVPFTGCPFQSAVLSRYKPRAKYLLRGAGLPTPAWRVVESLPSPKCHLAWPVIVKPANEDASVGIDQESVVYGQRELDERVAHTMRMYPPVVIEEFIDGREFNVSVVESPELRALPVSEIAFDRKSGLHPLVTYKAKWDVGSSEDLATPPRCPADISAALERRLQDLAIQAFRLFHCQDYARIDFRVDKADRPYILEVNPNPDYHPEAGLGRSLEVAGIGYRAFTLNLVQRAADRAGYSMSL